MITKDIERQTQSLRNLCLIAHVDAGKTTLAERMLYACGVISQMGEVGAGSTVTDFLPEERARGISIVSACVSMPWNGLHLNLVDTPGHIDFSSEVWRTLAVIDGCVVVVSAVDGLEAQTEMVWLRADEHALPRLIFLNKLDRPESDLLGTLQSLATRLRVTPILLNIPFYLLDAEDANKASLTLSKVSGTEPLLGLFDLVAGEIRTLQAWPKHLSATFKNDLNIKLKELSKNYREDLLAKLAEVDDSFLELWVKASFTPSQIRQTIAKCTRELKVVPVFCGAAKLNLGVDLLLDGIIHYLPNPLEGASLRSKARVWPSKRLEVKDSPRIDLKLGSQEDCLAFVWKIIHLGQKRLACLRLFSGIIQSGATLYSSSTGLGGPIKLFRLAAEQIDELDLALAGDLVACSGPNFALGDTLSATASSFALAPLLPQPPVLSQTIEPKREQDYPLLRQALAKCLDEDPSLVVTEDEATGSYLISGQGELQLKILLDLLQRELGLALQAKAPQVNYRLGLKREVWAEAEVAQKQEQSELYGLAKLCLEPTLNDDLAVSLKQASWPSELTFEDQAKFKRL